MKVVFYVLTTTVVFLFVFSFIVQNPHDIKIQYYSGVVWDGPIATLLLLTFGLGILFGLFATSLRMLKLKIRLVKSAKQLRTLQPNHPLRREQTTKDDH